jgi:hypothetical protein
VAEIFIERKRKKMDKEKCSGKRGLGLDKF